MVREICGTCKCMQDEESFDLTRFSEINCLNIEGRPLQNNYNSKARGGYRPASAEQIEMREMRIEASAHIAGIQRKLAEDAA